MARKDLDPRTYGKPIENLPVPTPVDGGERNAKTNRAFVPDKKIKPVKGTAVYVDNKAREAAVLNDKLSTKERQDAMRQGVKESDDAVAQMLRDAGGTPTSKKMAPTVPAKPVMSKPVKPAAVKPITNSRVPAPAVSASTPVKPPVAPPKPKKKSDVGARVAAASLSWPKSKTPKPTAPTIVDRSYDAVENLRANRGTTSPNPKPQPAPTPGKPSRYSPTNTGSNIKVPVSSTGQITRNTLGDTTAGRVTKERIQGDKILPTPTKPKKKKKKKT